ncbi:MAG: DEAD/DEAH box helicase [Oscillospiraceae bacterium]|nr:DEAD/DEAH box helicase [Oscillospiraceae bacterium]
MAPRTRKKKAFGVMIPRQVPNPRMPYPHQMNAIENLDRLDMRPSYSALLVLPTGGGKTYVASAWLIKAALDNGKKVLWLAHRTLLLDQAAEAFQEYTYEKDHPPLSPFRYRIVSGTSNHCRPSSISPKDDLLLVSKDSITRNVKCLDHWLEGVRELYLIVDEAHHSPAKSYRRIIDHIQEKVPCVKMIGLTATPFRKDLDNTGPLREIFRDDIVYQISLAKLIGSGILSTPAFENIPTHESYGEALGMQALESIQRSDLIPDDIAMQIARNAARNGLIVKTYLDKKDEYGQTIVFVLNVTHAEQLAAVFCKEGVAADYIVSGVRDLETGKITKKEENDEKLKAYREGKLRVLISVNILTEGVDLPATKTVFLARPTVSSVLMTQMVGRALRGPKAGGTLEAYIVTFIDDWGDNIAWINPKSLFWGKNDPEAEQLSQMQRDIRAIAVSKIAEFARMMDASIDTSALERLPFIERIPVGMYVFTYLEAADQKTGEATECSCQVMVYSNAVRSYAEMMENLPALFDAYGADGEYLDAELLSEMERQCYANFFRGGMLPPYAPMDVINILKYYAQMETIPEFYTFETVGKRLDLRRYISSPVSSSSGIRSRAAALAGSRVSSSSSSSRMFSICSIAHSLPVKPVPAAGDHLRGHGYGYLRRGLPADGQADGGADPVDFRRREARLQQPFPGGGHFFPASNAADVPRWSLQDLLQYGIIRLVAWGHDNHVVLRRDGGQFFHSNTVGTAENRRRIGQSRLVCGVGPLVPDHYPEVRKR